MRPPTTRAAVERRGGAGSPVSGPARPEAAAPGNRVSAVARGGRPSIARYGTSRKRPGASPGAPSSHWRGKEKEGDGPAWAPEDKAPGQRSVGWCVMILGDPAASSLRAKRSNPETHDIWIASSLRSSQ